jgi:hypothetical protein
LKQVGVHLQPFALQRMRLSKDTSYLALLLNDVRWLSGLKIIIYINNYYSRLIDDLSFILHQPLVIISESN